MFFQATWKFESLERAAKQTSGTMDPERFTCQEEIWAKLIALDAYCDSLLLDAETNGIISCRAAKFAWMFEFMFVPVCLSSKS